MYQQNPVFRTNPEDGSHRAHHPRQKHRFPHFFHSHDNWMPHRSYETDRHNMSFPHFLMPRMTGCLRDYKSDTVTSFFQANLSEHWETPQSLNHRWYKKSDRKHTSRDPLPPVFHMPADLFFHILKLLPPSDSLLSVFLHPSQKWPKTILSENEFPTESVWQRLPKAKKPSGIQNLLICFFLRS